MDKPTRTFLIFLIKLLLIWLSWKLFVFVVGVESQPLNERFFPVISSWWEQFNHWYKAYLLDICASALKLIGYPAWVERSYSLRIGDLGGVSVGNYCLAFQLIYYFTMLIVISGLHRPHKIFGIITGFLMVNVLNIIRLCTLAIISAYYYRLSYFFHDYVFNIIVFGSLMVFYYWLMNRVETK